MGSTAFLRSPSSAAAALAVMTLLLGGQSAFAAVEPKPPELYGEITAEQAAG